MQGCQVVCFQTKQPNLGKFCRALKRKKVGIFYGQLEYITAFWYILWPFGNLVAIWYNSFHFGISNEEKSGNPDERERESLFRR
jgi:hypothetical protein